ncbi:hypothetical protein [Lacihabitans sp. LS3-19]|uniref:hypothetical protein n=1 Tax=Lacihabitans sp. LS3-19 TaxID=2487335 RepID=UPI0020CC8400|nr:hypothetical protein [Lacihabitans sp. LS3-19]
MKTSERQEKIYEFFTLFPTDSVGVMQALKIVGAYGKKHGDLHLEMCEPSGYLVLLSKSKTISNETYKKAIDSVYTIYKNRKMGEVFLASFERKLAEYYMYREKNYALGFKHFQQGFDLLKKVDIEEYPYKVQETLGLLYNHYDFEDYEKCIYFAKETLKEDKKIKNRNLAGALKMHMAYAFRDLGQLDSADVYFNQVIDEAKDRGDWVQYGTALCYLGYNCYLKNDFAKAESLFKKGIAEIGNDAGMKPVKVLFFSYLAEIKSRDSELESSKAYLKELNILKAQTAYKGNQVQVYKNLSNVYKRMGDSELALAYLDSMEIAEEYMRVNYDSKRFIREQQQEEIDKVRREKETLVFWRNITLYFLSLVFILSLIIYWLSLSKKKAEMLQIQLELEHSKKELLLITEHFKKKRPIRPGSVEGPEYNSILQILEESTILTKEDWETFKNHFEKVYPGFLRNLVKTYPDLTQGEIRFISLKKLGLSNKEMAETLGVSDQSIRTTLHRLRKKVNLSSDDDIELLIQKI